MKNLEKIKNDYIDELKKFIEKNNLETDFLEDIEERIAEKLEKIENPKENDLRKILKEIWTPKEIFREELEQKNEEKDKNFLKKFFEKTEKIIFLWVFYELSKKTEISANIFRILFLFLIFVGFLGNGFLFPVLIFTYFIGFLLLRTRFFGFIFSLWLTIFFLAFLIFAVFLFGMYLVDFSIENMHIFMNISPLFPVWMMIWIFSLILFIIYFSKYTFTKKFLNIWFLITAIISFFIAITIWASIIFWMVTKWYGKIIYENKEIIAEVPKPEKDFVFWHSSLSSWFLDPRWENKNIFWFSLWHIYSHWPDIWLSPDDKMHFSIEKTYIWIPGWEKIFDIKDIKIDKYLHWTVEVSNSLEKYPLSVTQFDLRKVLIPKNVLFRAGMHTNFVNSNYKEIIVPNSEKYSVEEREKIAFACEIYFYDDNWKPNCMERDEKSIEKILKYGSLY